MYIPVVVRGENSFDPDENSRCCAIDFGDEPSLCQQQFKDDSDINIMMERFGVTGLLPMSVRVPQYGDFTGISDYQSALNAVIAADEAFMELPAHVRERFGHSSEALINFCADDKNRDEAIRLGIVFEPPVIEPSSNP